MPDDTELLVQIINAARLSFDACRERVGASEIFGYAICSDDTAIACTPIAASLDGLHAFSLRDPNDFRFNPEEWDVQHEAAELQDVNDAIYLLYEQSEDYENNDNWHQEYRSRMYELYVQALERLDGDGYFGAGKDRDAIFVIAWVVDSLVPKQRGVEWSARLNRPAMHDAFVKWLSTTDYWG